MNGPVAPEIRIAEDDVIEGELEAHRAVNGRTMNGE
jgi:hypothetical protein